MIFKKERSSFSSRKQEKISALKMHFEYDIMDKGKYSHISECKV